MLEVDWTPSLTQDAIRVLDKCDSLLEAMYLFGAIYFLECICKRAGYMSVGDWPGNTRTVVHRGKYLEGIAFQEMWPLWIDEIGDDCGPQSILFVPQIEFGDNYHHDFGIFYGDKYCQTDKWQLRYAVEIDGYVIHKKRREIDKYRDSLVDYQVVRLLEEIHNPLKWFRSIMESDSEYLHEETQKHC